MSHDKKQGNIENMCLDSNLLKRRAQSDGLNTFHHVVATA